jgi:hypothetical protein
MGNSSFARSMCSNPANMYDLLPSSCIGCRQRALVSTALLPMGVKVNTWWLLLLSLLLLLLYIYVNTDKGEFKTQLLKAILQVLMHLRLQSVVSEKVSIWQMHTNYTLMTIRVGLLITPTDLAITSPIALALICYLQGLRQRTWRVVLSKANMINRLTINRLKFGLPVNRTT